jgi:hypothetical protein
MHRVAGKQFGHTAFDLFGRHAIGRLYADRGAGAVDLVFDTLTVTDRARLPSPDNSSA